MLKIIRNLREEEVFLVLISFWITVLGTRSVIFYFIKKYSVIPGFFLHGIHIHHYMTGIAILAFCLAFCFRKNLKKGFFHLLFVGVGSALVFDEVSLWFNPEGNYWALENFFATAITGAVLIIFYVTSKKSRKLEIRPKRRKHKNPENPYITVVIPAYNEEKFFSKTLKSILAQDYDNFELIVVDNNSSDNTVKIAEKYGAKVIKEEKQGVVFARQKGFLEAKGEIIATTDADTILPSKWLSVIADNFKKNKELVLFGGLCNLYSGPITAKFSAFYLLYPYKYLDRFMSGGWTMPGANLAVRKRAFLKVGGFDLSTKGYEDIELSQRIKIAGETDMDPYLRVETSGRRFRHGLIHGIRPWVVNEMIRIFEVDKKFVGQSNIRTEKSFWGKALSFVPVVSLFIALFCIFYLANPAISQAKQVKAVKSVVSAINSKREGMKNYLLKIKAKGKANFFESKL